MAIGALILELHLSCFFYVDTIDIIDHRSSIVLDLLIAVNDPSWISWLTSMLSLSWSYIIFAGWSFYVGTIDIIINRTIDHHWSHTIDLHHHRHPVDHPFVLLSVMVHGHYCPQESSEASCRPDIIHIMVLPPALRVLCWNPIYHGPTNTLKVGLYWF